MARGRFSLTRAYYNEIDTYCAGWLYNLIQAGLIADGDIDTRSIADVRPSDLKGYTQCHFFAGLGGWSGALRLAGWPDDREVWTGSCPCQPFSLAGKQGGFADERHLWPYWHHLIAVGKPPVVFGEQVASATDWLGLVRSDLEALDYAVGAMPVQAASAGADHLRDRYWFVADANVAGESEGRRLLPKRTGERFTGPDGMADADIAGESERRQQRSGEFSGPRGDQEARDSCKTMGDTDCARWNGTRQPGEAVSESEAVERSGGRSAGDYEWVIGADGKARRAKPGIRLLAHGIPARVAKLRALGNAIDLRPAAEFIKAFAASEGT